MRVLRCAVHGLAIALAALAPSCVVDDLDLEGLRCPCTDGWVCDVASDRCVRGAESDAGQGIDAGLADVDAGHADAGPPLPFCQMLSDAVFCEDFEGDGDWQARWKEVPAVEDGSIQAMPLAGRSGIGLRVLAPASPSKAMLTAALDTVATGELHFRAFVRVGAASGPIDLFVLSAADREGSVSATLVPETRSFRVEVDDGTDARASDARRGDAWQWGQWFCVSAVVERGPTGRVRVNASGPRAAELVAIDTDLGAPYDAFSIAIDEAGAELELDDVTWTRAPLACP